MFDESIKVLQELAKKNQESSKEIGFTIGLINFCKKHNISRNDKVHCLPMASEAFGFFTIQECTEMGDPIKTLADENGNELEFISEALVIERKN
jgi:hypothetical protein